MKIPDKPKFQIAPDIIRERVVECMDLARKRYEHAIRPVYGKSGQSAPVHIGSCTLLEIDGAKVLLTAAHVIDDAKHCNLFVAGTTQLVPLTFDKAVVTNPELDRKKDRYDFSLAKITKAMQRDLGEVHYIPESNFCLNTPTSEAHVRMVMGFPHSKNKKGINNPLKEVSGTVWSFSNVALSDEQLATNLGMPTGNHIFLGFDHTKQYRADGRSSYTMHPLGASGGALFDLGDQTKVEKLARPVVCEARLAGVLIEYKERKKLIMATGMNAVLEGYRRLCELR